MSSRRRHHNGPPPSVQGVYPDDYSHPSNYYGPSYLQSSGYYNRGPPPPAYNSLDNHRRADLPVDHVEPSRGRRPSRQPAYSDLRGRGFEPRHPQHDYDDLPHARRHPRSYSQGHSRGGDVRDGLRGRPPPSRHGRDLGGGSSASRSKSLSSSSQREGQKENTGSPWWQHPIVRTCAVTALSTGLSAALDSRGDPGQWKGAKGAKVAVATLGSALVDGFLGQRHPGGLRHNVMKKGVEVAMDEAEKKKHRGEDKIDEAVEAHERRHSNGRDHSRQHSHGRSRHRSHGRSHGRRH